MSAVSLSELSSNEGFMRETASPDSVMPLSAASELSSASSLSRAAISDFTVSLPSALSLFSAIAAMGDMSKSNTVIRASIFFILTSFL